MRANQANYATRARLAAAGATAAWILLVGASEAAAQQGGGGTPRGGVITIGDVSVDFAGRPDRATLARFRAQSGMVFQSHNLFPHKTVIQNVLEGPVVVQRRPRAFRAYGLGRPAGGSGCPSGHPCARRRQSGSLCVPRWVDLNIRLS